MLAQKADALWESMAASDPFFAEVYHNQKAFVAAYAGVVNSIEPDIPMLLKYGK